MVKSGRKVVIDEFRRQVAGLPGKAFAQDRELLPVAGLAPILSAYLLASSRIFMARNPTSEALF